MATSTPEPSDGATSGSRRRRCDPLIAPDDAEPAALRFAARLAWVVVARTGDEVLQRGPPTMLVGRRSERRALTEWAADAWAGQMRIVTIIGEPGVGKTTLADDLIATESSTGTTVFAASCHDDLGVPLLPLVSALRSEDILGDAIGALSSDDLQLRIGRDPRVFMRLTDVLLASASRGRVILCLDDVHWADRGSLDLLTHLVTSAARQNAMAPVTLLVLLTTRPTTAGQPPNEALARIAQERAHRVLALDPLDELAVNEMLRILTGAVPSGRLLADVIEVTGGNPLFVRSLVDELRGRGELLIDGDTVLATTEVRAGPNHLDHFQRGQLDRLGTEARELVTVASLMDSPLDIGTLTAAIGWDEARVEQALDEAERIGVIHSTDSDEVIFRHPTVRQLVAGDRSSRSIRVVHRQIAERLTELDRGDSDEHTIQVAHHLRRAGRGANPIDVARIGGRAAELSAGYGAWTRAARYAELALNALPHLDAAQRQALVPTESDLRHIAALSHLRNHDPIATEEHCAAAIDLARQSGDLEAWGRALLLEQRSKLSLRPEALQEALDGNEIRDFLDLAGDRAPRAGAQCWQLLAEMAVLVGGQDRHAAEEAIRLARELADDALRAWAHFADGLTDFVALKPDPAIAAMLEGENAARSSGEDWVLSALLVRRALAELMAGDLERAATTIAEAERNGLATHNWGEYGLALAGAAELALARGDLASAERLAQDALAAHARSSSPYTALFAWPTLAYVRALRRDHLGARQALDDWEASGVFGASRFRLLVDLMDEGEDGDAVPVDLDRYAPASRHTPTVFDAAALAVDVELGVNLGLPDLLSDALTRLRQLEEQGMRTLLPTGADIGRLIGMAQIALGDVDLGIARLRSSEQDLEAAGARTELLRCRVERCLAMAARDPTSVTELATTLGEELDESSMLGFLDRLRLHLPDSVGSGVRLNRTVVVWDLVASTPLLVDAGDRGYVDVIHELNDLISRRLEEHHGIAFKYSGDGVFAWFLDAADALHCAVDVRIDLAHRNRRSRRPLILRTGVATGQPVPDEGDLFGLAVVTAARLCDMAGSEQILSTADTAAAAGSALPVEAVDDMGLKGIAEPVAVVSVVP